MSKLSEKSYKTLEFYTILHELSELCVSRKAKEQARDLRPMHDVEDVRLALQQTDDAKKMMTTSGTPAFGGIREVSASLSRADRGGVLSTRELLDVASLLHAAMQISKYGKEQELEIYEGMAKWVEIQYAYLIGEPAAAKREEISARLREDEYGRGFRKYVVK